MDSLALTVAGGMLALPYMMGNPASVSGDAPRQSWRRPPVGISSPISMDDVGCRYQAGEDLTVLPGYALTQALIQRMSEQRTLLGVINQLRSNPFSRFTHDGSVVLTQAAIAAQAFIAALPNNVELPHVMPDGDGGLMFTWGSGLGGALVIVDGVSLHAVANPTTPAALYVDDVPFIVTASGLPQEILDVLPTI